MKYNDHYWLFWLGIVCDRFGSFNVFDTVHKFEDKQKNGAFGKK